MILGVGFEDDNFDSWSGPIVTRITGKTTRPWNSPNTTVKVKTLKKVLRTCPVEKDPSARARKVVRPPLRTAGPMVMRALTVFSSLSPGASYQ